MPKSSAGPESDAAAIARTRDALLEAVNGSDLAGVLAVWTDEGVLMPPHHPSVRGRLEIERYFSRLFGERRFEFAFTTSRLHVSGDVAVERVEYVASAWPGQGGSTDRDAGKGIHVYRRETDGSWKLTADIWNSDRPMKG
jgi:uncharacterized protein (TIGR02246 family)